MRAPKLDDRRQSYLAALTWSACCRGRQGERVALIVSRWIELDWCRDVAERVAPDGEFWRKAHMRWHHNGRVRIATLAQVALGRAWIANYSTIWEAVTPGEKRETERRQGAPPAGREGRER